MKLGKKAPKHDHRTLRLAKYLAGTPLPAAPASVSWSAKIGTLGEMLNSELGDCTCAAAGHMIQGWTGNAYGEPVILQDQDILLAYEAVGGYIPGDPSTDNGAVEIEVLNYWRNNGLGPAGHKIAAYASVNVKDETELTQAINLFGGIYVGVALPISAQSQIGGVWDVTSGSNSSPGSWGGHAIPILDYDQDTFTCVTWGALQKMTWAFFLAYCDEAYALITPDWIAVDGASPSGFNLATLQSDLALLVS